jgi:hypothetical protein
LQIIAEKGYLIPAINTDSVDYVSCAKNLADSILSWHPRANITILTKEMLPYGDQGGYANDWQVFKSSPYRQTIKLEADMIATSPVDHWWPLFETKDLVISTGCRNFYDELSTARHHRKIFDANNLPDVYNAITYWRVSSHSYEFFKLVRKIFENWNQFKTLLKFPDNQATTDVVYAMAAQIMGSETCTLPYGVGPSIVHMKRYINPIQSLNWTKELIWEHTDPGLRINTVAQWGFVHYHIKDWISCD